MRSLARLAALTLAGCLLSGCGTVSAANFKTVVHTAQHTLHQITKTPASTASLHWINEPEAGISPWLRAIAQAHHTIEVNDYLLTDSRLIQALRQAAHRGVTVQVIIDGKPYGDASAVRQTRAAFAGSRVQLKSAPARFEGTYAYDHAKYLVVDPGTSHGLAILGSANGTASAFTGYNLEDDVETTAPSVVGALHQVFTADWQNRIAGLAPRGTLVLSPGAEPQLLALLASPGPVAVMTEELGSAQSLYAALMTHRSAARVLVPASLSTEGRIYATALAAAGVQIRTLQSPYVHAKLIVTKTRTFVGSQNFSVVSFNDNREVGLITRAASIHGQALAWFNAEWTRATPWGQTPPPTSSGASGSSSGTLSYLPDGDTMAQVQALWGKPASISHDVYRGTPETVWHYSIGTVYFEHGLVSYVQRS